MGGGQILELKGGEKKKKQTDTQREEESTKSIYEHSQ